MGVFRLWRTPKCTVMVFLFFFNLPGRIGPSGTRSYQTGFCVLLPGQAFRSRARMGGLWRHGPGFAHPDRRYCAAIGGRNTWGVRGARSPTPRENPGCVRHTSRPARRTGKRMTTTRSRWAPVYASSMERSSRGANISTASCWSPRLAVRMRFGSREMISREGYPGMYGAAEGKKWLLLPGGVYRLRGPNEAAGRCRRRILMRGR
jgi:hypothetical protein